MKKFMKSIIASVLTVGLLLSVTAVPSFGSSSNYYNDNSISSTLVPADTSKGILPKTFTDYITKAAAVAIEKGLAGVIISLPSDFVVNDGFTLDTGTSTKTTIKDFPIIIDGGIFNLTSAKIEIKRDNVTIRNAKINSSIADFAIYATTTNVKNVKIEDNEIFLGNANGWGIVTDASGANITISGNKFSGTAMRPISINKAGNLTLTNNVIDGTYNDNAAAALKSETYIEADKAIITGNTFKAANTKQKAGLKIAKCADAVVDNNTFSNCDFALRADKGAFITSFKNNNLDYSTSLDTLIWGVEDVNATTKYDVIGETQINGTFAGKDVNKVYYKPIEKTDDSTQAPSTGSTGGGYYYPTYVAPTTGDPFVYVGQNATTAPNATSAPTDTTQAPTTGIKDAVITARNTTIKAGEKFDIMKNVKAKDNGGKGADLTKKVTAEGTINTKKVGSYSITYKVKGANGNVVKKSVTLYVK